MFGVSVGNQDITRSSGMIRRIRFIYRKSFYKFENDLVHLWKVLEKSERNHYGRRSPGGTPLARPVNPKGRSPRWAPPKVAGQPTSRKGGRVGLPP